jgi:Rod binding domain-containing protein
MGLDSYAEMRRMDKLPKSEQMARAAGQFEGLLVRQFLNESMKPLVKGGCLDGEEMPGGDIYQSLMVNTLADGIEAGGGLGLSNVIRLQLQGPSAGGAKGMAHNADENA